MALISEVDFKIPLPFVRFWCSKQSHQLIRREGKDCLFSAVNTK